VAICIPDSNIKFKTAGERKIFSFLRQLPDSCIVYYDLDIGSQNKKPDFVIIDLLRGITIFEVKDWGIDSIKEISPARIKVESRNKSIKPMPNPERQVNFYLEDISDQLTSQISLCNNKGRLDVDVHSFVVFPNLLKDEFYKEVDGKSI